MGIFYLHPHELLEFNIPHMDPIWLQIQRFYARTPRQSRTDEVSPDCRHQKTLARYIKYIMEYIYMHSLLSKSDPSI